MKSLILFLTLILFGLNLGTPVLSQPTATKPEKVYRLVYVQKSNEWYQQQEKLWKKEIEKNRQHAEAWENYYNAVRYANYLEMDYPTKQARLKTIVQEMEQAIPGTFVYYMSHYRTFCNVKDISSLEKAYQLQPENPETYTDFISHYEFEGDAAQKAAFCKKLYQSRILAPGLMNYNYNVLMSVESNAILFTNGDNDTYPGWVLQAEKGIQKEVTILNLALSSEKDYLQRKLKQRNIQINLDALFQKVITQDKSGKVNFSTETLLQELCRSVVAKYPQIPVYIALTVMSNYYDALKADLYLTGLAFKYSPQRVDNIALIKQNVEQHFRLDYLKYDWYNEPYQAETIVAHLNLNYVSPLVMLAEYYKTGGQKEKCKALTDLALLVADKAGSKEKVQSSLKSKGLLP